MLAKLANKKGHSSYRSACVHQWPFMKPRSPSVLHIRPQASRKLSSRVLTAAHIGLCYVGFTSALYRLSGYFLFKAAQELVLRDVFNSRFALGVAALPLKLSAFNAPFNNG